MKDSIKKLADSRFTNAKGAELNRVFLWENHDTKPFIRPVSGWEIIGYGKAPWPGCSEGFAVMFEKTTPAEKDNGSMFQKSHLLFDEGTQIWQHINKNTFLSEILVVKG